MNILVTGAAGFTASHLLEELLKADIVTFLVMYKEFKYKNRFIFCGLIN